MRNRSPVQRDLIESGIIAYIQCGNMRIAADQVGINRLTLRHNINSIKAKRSAKFDMLIQVEWKRKIEIAERKFRGVRYD